MTLLLHTSTSTASLGLADGERIIAREAFPIGRDLAATLADRVKKFLETEGYTLGAIEKIVIHTGPGSFTSLRLGVTVANALAHALTIPVVGVSGPLTTLEELLERSRKEAPPGNIAVPVYERGPALGPISSPLPSK